jgi:hypothetical protein
VVLSPVELGHCGQVEGLAVHPGADEPALLDVLEEFPELSLPTPDQRREHLDARPLRPGEHGVRDLAGALALHRTAVVGAMRHAGPGPEEPEVVVHLRDGADGGPRIFRRRLLLDGDGGREPLDRVDVGLLHLLEELPGVRRQALDVATLPLGVDRVEREETPARSPVITSRSRGI